MAHEMLQQNCSIYLCVDWDYYSYFFKGWQKAPPSGSSKKRKQQKSHPHHTPSAAAGQSKASTKNAKRRAKKRQNQDDVSLCVYESVPYINYYFFTIACRLRPQPWKYRPTESTHTRMGPQKTHSIGTRLWSRRNSRKI